MNTVIVVVRLATSFFGLVFLLLSAYNGTAAIGDAEEDMSEKEKARSDVEWRNFCIYGVLCALFFLATIALGGLKVD